MQRDLEHSVDVAHAQLDQSINQSDGEVDGIKTTSWDKQSSGKGRDLDRLVSMQRQRQAVIRDTTTVSGEIEKLTAARTEEDRARAARELSCICLGGTAQAKMNREAVAGAEGGRVIGTLLQFLTPRYAVSTQREGKPTSNHAVAAVSVIDLD